MEHKLMWGALGIGIVGWLCASLLLLSRPRNSALGSAAMPEAISLQSRDMRPGFVWVSFLLPVLVWLATLPVKAPFSPGQGWGRGFLLGGMVAFLSIWVPFRAFSEPGFKARSASAISLCGAIIAVSVPLLWMRSSVVEALLGGALGWVTVSLVWLLGIYGPQRHAPQRDAQDDAAEGLATEGLAILISNGGAFATALFCVAALGVYRDFVVADVARGTYAAVAVALAASVALVFLASALLGAIAAADDAISLVPSVAIADLFPVALGIVVPLGTGYLLATKFLDDLACFYVVAIGVALGGLCWMLARDEATCDEESRGEARGAQRFPVAVTLVALCGFMLSYQIMQGFGAGLMLLAAWPILLLALPDSAGIDQGAERAQKFDLAQTLSLLGSFGAMLLISRLFATRFRADLRGTELDDQFALFGFLAGAVVPSLLASLWFETRQSASRSLWRVFPAAPSPARLFCVAMLALLILGAMLTLWGIKIVPAFLLGLALSVVGFGNFAASRTQKSALSLFALSLALTLAQWTQRFLPLAEWPRAQRLHFLFWSLAGAVSLFLVIDYGARVVFWMRHRAKPSGETL